MIQLALQRDAAPQPGVRRWIYAGEDTSWRVRAEHGALKGLERVPTGDLVEAASWRLREPYIEWIGRLSQANASLEWWASELAAKNPFTFFYARLCALAAAREALTRDSPPALVVCSTEALLGELSRFCDESGIAWERVGRKRPDMRPLARQAVDVAGGLVPPALVGRLPLGARRAFEENTRFRARLLADTPRPGTFAGERTALLFTWVDERSVVDGRYVDPHFGELPRMLRDAGWEVAFVARVLPSAGSIVDVTGALAATGERFYFPEQWLEREDLAACSRRAKAFHPAISYAAIDGVPAVALAREQAAELRWLQVFSLEHALLVERLAAGGVRPARVMLPFEGHAWEQATVAAVRSHMPEAVTVGFDNVNFSRLALSLYPARSEIDIRPLPDRIVTSGRTFERILAGEGFPAERVRSGCALRHTHLAGVEPGSGGRVLVAGSIDAGETFEMIEKALAAFSDDPKRLIVKLHPAVDREQLMRWVTDLPGHAQLEFSERRIPELLPDADAMLYGYSVVCYEALAAGVQPIFVKAETFLDLDQLEPYPELRRPARTPEEIRAAVDEVTARSDEERRNWIEHARAAVAESLVPLSDGCVKPFVD